MSLAFVKSNFTKVWHRILGTTSKKGIVFIIICDECYDCNYGVYRFIRWCTQPTSIFDNLWINTTRLNVLLTTAFTTRSTIFFFLEMWNKRETATPLISMTIFLKNFKKFINKMVMSRRQKKIYRNSYSHQTPPSLTHTLEMQNSWRGQAPTTTWHREKRAKARNPGDRRSKKLFLVYFSFHLLLLCLSALYASWIVVFSFSDISLIHLRFYVQ